MTKVVSEKERERKGKKKGGGMGWSVSKFFCAIVCQSAHAFDSTRKYAIHFGYIGERERERERERRGE